MTTPDLLRHLKEPDSHSLRILRVRGDELTLYRSRGDESLLETVAWKHWTGPSVRNDRSSVHRKYFNRSTCGEPFLGCHNGPNRIWVECSPLFLSVRPDPGYYTVFVSAIDLNSKYDTRVLCSDLFSRVSLYRSPLT